MAGNRFDSSYDPAFDLRAAEISQAATVQQEAADAADGATTDVATPEGEPAGDGGSALEHAGGDLLAAAEDGLLAVAAPALAPVVAAVAAGEAVLDAGKDAYHAASDATDAIGDIFGGGDEHPGQSTFATDPDAAPESPEEYAAKMEQAKEAMDKAGADFDKSVRLWDGRHDGVQELDMDRHGDPIGDIRLQDTAALDIQVTTGAAAPLELDPDVVGSGAAGGAVASAPDGAMVPVDELRDHVGIGAAGGNAVVAPDGGMEPVAGLSADVAIGADSVIDVDHLPSADHAPADVAFGADVQLNPQPIPPGMGADLGSPVAETVMGDLSFGSDVQLNPQPIPPGMGADVQLNVQPEDRTGMGADKVPADYAPDDHSGLSAPKVPADYAPDDHSGLSADKGEPAADAAVHQALSVDDSSIIIVGGAEAAIDVNEPPTADNAPVPIALGADVQLNPQPIPPGIGADIGEPAADVAVDQAPSGDDSSIIIVGGTEAAVPVDDADPGFAGANDLNIADSPMDQDIASTLAADTDGPAFQAVDIDEAAFDVGITEDEFDG